MTPLDIFGAIVLAFLAGVIVGTPDKSRYFK